MRLKIFFASFFLSVPLWIGLNSLANGLEGYFYNSRILSDPKIISANMQEKLLADILDKRIPSIKPQIPPLDISAKSALSVWVDFGTGKTKDLYEKNSKEVLPIASLTKLFDADIILGYYDLSQEIKIDRESMSLLNSGVPHLKEGDVFYLNDLINSMLIESDNNAAFAIAKVLKPDNFVAMMNLEAQNLGLTDTSFVNVTGLDEDHGRGNVSTVRDLENFSQYLLKSKPRIWDILSKQEYQLYLADGSFHHKAINTNDLLFDPDVFWRARIVGGKTGETDIAKGCLVVVLKDLKSRGYIINVLLSSDNRFDDMKKMVDWVNGSYQWN